MAGDWLISGLQFYFMTSCQNQSAADERGSNTDEFSRTPNAIFILHFIRVNPRFIRGYKSPSSKTVRRISRFQSGLWTGQAWTEQAPSLIALGWPWRFTYVWHSFSTGVSKRLTRQPLLFRRVTRLLSTTVMTHPPARSS